MPNPRWFDDGVRVNLSVSTAGDFVALGTRTEYPFVASGGNAPTGWTVLLPNGGAAGDVNWTTANGRFSTSNISTTNSHQNVAYGIYRDFPCSDVKRYVAWVQARTMDNKAGVRWQFTYQFNGTGNAYGFQGVTADDWEQIACYMLPPAGTTFLRVRLLVWYFVPAGTVERFDWGGQWQLPAMVEYLSDYPPPTWKEVTCDVQSLQIAYGRSKFTGRYEVASAQIGVTNVDGEFTYQPVHPWGLRPGRFVKVTISDPNHIYYPAFYGLIDSITDSFPRDGKVVAMLNCIDTSSLLSNSTVPTESTVTTTAQSGIRFRSLLDNVAWHPGMRVFDDGIYYQQGVVQNGRTIRDEMGLGADSEGAHFWCDRSGILTFRDRNYVKNNPRSNSVYAELLAECPEYLPESKFVFPGVSGNGMTVVYDPSFTFATSVDVAALVKCDDMSRSGDFIGMDSTWAFRLSQPGAFLQFNNGSGSATSTVSVSSFANTETWFRAVYNRANGTVIFYYSSPTGVVWLKLGATVSITGTMPSTANRAIRIGGNGGSFVLPHKGTINGIRLYDSTTPLLNFTAAMFPGYEGATVLNIQATGQQIVVSQTGTNKIVQLNPAIAPHQLPPVDTVPTATTAVVQLLKALETDWSRDRVVNDVQIANQGGSAYQAVDHDSQQKYGPRTYQRLDFLNDNAHPEYLVERTADFMTGFTDSILRVNQVTFVPNVDTYTWALTMFMTELVRVRYQHPTEGWGYALATRIQGYVHTLTLNGWETTLNLDQPQSFVYWDTPDGGIGWDGDYWDDGIWDNDNPKASYWSSGEVWSDSGTKWS